MLDETTALIGPATTKEKNGYTPLVVVFTALLLVLALYAGQNRQGRGTSRAVAAGGTTRGAIPTSLLFSSAEEASSNGALGACVESVGTYQSNTDYCFTCGGGEDDDGTLNYCWNNQECFPLCANAQGVGGRLDGECGTACTTFADGKRTQQVGIRGKYGTRYG